MMFSKIRLNIILQRSSLILLLFCYIACDAVEQKDQYEWSGLTMGTSYQVKVSGIEMDKDRNLLKEGFCNKGEYVGQYYKNSGCISGDCNNGFGTYIQKEGNRYKGQFKNGIFDGYGLLQYIKGGKYDG